MASPYGYTNLLACIHVHAEGYNHFTVHCLLVVAHPLVLYRGINVGVASPRTTNSLFQHKLGSLHNKCETGFFFGCRFGCVWFHRTVCFCELSNNRHNPKKGGQQPQPQRAELLLLHKQDETMAGKKSKAKSRKKDRNVQVVAVATEEEEEDNDDVDNNSDDDDDEEEEVVAAVEEDDNDDDAEEDDDNDDDDDDDDDDGAMTVKSELTADDEKAATAAAGKMTSKGAATLSSSKKRRRSNSSAPPAALKKGRTPAVQGITIPFRSIKRTMKLDPIIGTVQNEAAILTTLAAELFVEALAKESHQNAKSRGRNTIRYEDVAEARSKNSAYSFLIPLIP